MGHSNSPCINVHAKCLLNKLITLQKETDKKSSISTNDEITYYNNTSEEISCHQNSGEVNLS